MLIGAMKSGTTALSESLSAHPEVCFSTIKEPGFFNTTANWHAELDRYHRLFDPAPGQLCAEASTMYTRLQDWPQTAERLYAYNPELKLIYIMRHPVQRMISHYAHRKGHGHKTLPPEQALLRNPGYINTSRYALQLRPYLELFGREQVLPLIFEQYLHDPAATLTTVAEFLDIDPTGFSAQDAKQPKNPSVGQLRWHPRLGQLKRHEPWRTLGRNTPEGLRNALRRVFGVRLDRKPAVSPELRTLLWRFVEDDVKAVEELIGRELTEWRDG